MKWFVLGIILFSIICNALMDSIDHMKRGRGVYELWHVIKEVSYWVVYLTLMLVVGCAWWMIFGSIIVSRIVWEITYMIGIDEKLYKVDDSWTVTWIQRICGFHKP